MKTKILKSLITPVLGLSAIGTITITSTSCGSEQHPDEQPIHPVEVKLDEHNLKLSTEDKPYQLHVDVFPEDSGVYWESNNTDVVTVDYNDGTITPFEPGEATITVISGANPNVTDTCKVEVIRPIHVDGIELDLNNVRLNIGDSRKINYFIEPKEATNKEVIWSSSDESIVSVSQDGKFICNSGGKATIIVTSADNESIKATCDVEVRVPIENFEFSKSEFEIPLGQTEKLITIVSPEDATNKDEITWKSSDLSIATVDQGGYVTTINEGTTTITATIHDYNDEEKTTTCDVTVIYMPVASIELDKDNVDLSTGQTEQLTATILPENATDQRVTWASSDPDTVLVFDDGKIRGVKAGTATIIATSVDNESIKATCEVNVYTPIEHVAIGGKIGDEIVELLVGKAYMDDKITYVGNTLQLVPIVEPQDVIYEQDNIIWHQNNVGSIAYVSKEGLVSFNGAGTAIISVEIKTKYGTFLSDEIRIIIYDKNSQ